MNRSVPFVLILSLSACMDYDVHEVVVGPGGPAASPVTGSTSTGAHEPDDAQDTTPPASTGTAGTAGTDTAPAGSTTTGPPAADTGSPDDPEPRQEVLHVPAFEPAPTGVLVVAGERVTVSVAGTWCWGGGADCSDADGTPGRPVAEELPVLVTGASFGTLAASIDGGLAFVVGSGPSLDVPATGELYLGMSDRIGSYGDNSGELVVTLTWE